MTAREILERQFPTELIRRRSGRNGDEVVYLEASTVVARLNEAFAGEWSFVVEKHEVLADEVIVLGRLSAGAVGKSAFGSSAVTRAREGGKAVSLGDDLKAAATDSLKKAATLLGVGLNLHVQPEPTPRTRVPERELAPVPSTKDNLALSGAQLRALHAIRKTLGWDEAQLADFALSHVGVRDVEKLDKRAASSLIEKLQGQGVAAGAQR